MLPPLVFVPILKQIRWGGRRLGTLLRKPIGDASDYAESWEIADHADGQSVVSCGRLAGTTLRSLLDQFPAELMGSRFQSAQFPLLIKLLDANDWLSLQVHPNDEQARRYNVTENGKTEAWIILESSPDSRICAGLKEDVDRETLEQALRSNSVESCLNQISVAKGDCVFVPAGTVHAIGPEIVLAEVQQQSNLTFRLFDWGRTDASGKPRPIHLTESLDCIDFQRGPVFPVVPRILSDRPHLTEELVSCEHFVIRRHQFSEDCTIRTEDAFRILMVLAGEATLANSCGTVQAEAGTTVLIPACSDAVNVTAQIPVTMLEIHGGI